MAEYLGTGMSEEDLEDLPGLPMPSAPLKPTLAYISALATWAGGSLQSVPYNAPNMTSIADTGEPTPSTESVVTGVWGGFWGRVAREMKYIRREFADEVRGDTRLKYFPDNWTIRVPSTGPDKIQQSLGQIFVGDPSVVMEGPRRRGKSDLQRQKVDSTITQMLMNQSQHEEQMADASPLNQIKSNCLPLGMSARAVMLDPDWVRRFADEPEQEDGESRDEFNDRLDDWKEERRNSSPIKSYSIHPLNLCYDRVNKPMQWALVRTPIDPYVAKQQYPHWRGGDSVDMPGQAAQYLCLARFWTPKWTAVFIDGEAALGPEDGADEEGIAPNPYNFIPIWPAAGGHGWQDPKSRPEYELRGMMADHLDLLLEDAYCENLEQIYLKGLTYGPKRIITGGPDDKASQRDITRQLRAGPEEPVWIPGEARVDPLNAEPIPDWLVARRRRLDLRIDSALGYNIQFGASDPAEAAVRSKFRASQAEKRYADAVLHMQQAEEGYYKGILKILKYVLRRPIDVNMTLKDGTSSWESLDPADIPDNPRIVVQLTGESEDEKARKQAEDDARLASPIPTLDIAEYLVRRGEKDVEGRIAAIEADKLYAAAYAPILQMLAQKGAAAIVAAELASRGIELDAAEIIKEYQALIAEGQLQGGSKSPGGSSGGNGNTPYAGPAINGAGTALPGTSTEDAESGISDNPIATRPGSPEAVLQERALNQQDRNRAAGPAAQPLAQTLPGY